VATWLFGCHPLAALSTLKILLVVAFFMHLRWRTVGSRWCSPGRCLSRRMVLIVLAAVA